VTFSRRVIALLPRVHPGIVLASLDLVGLAIATYLSVVELQGLVPYCGQLTGCEQVALSEYARIGGVPVAALGMVLSISLLILAIAWTRTDRVELLAAHYGLSLLGVVFEVYFTYLEVFVIGAICIWCASYGLSLLVRFGVALWVWRRRALSAPA
jgi:uncharacterized membrane protein